MTAHNTATREYAERRTQFVIDRLDVETPYDPQRYLWVRRLKSALRAPRQGGIRAWLEAHDGTPVETLQVDVQLYGAEPAAMARLWTPGARMVSARPTYVWLGSSRRYYRGVVTLASDPDLWLGFAPGWDAVQLICFASRDRVRAEAITRDILADESLGTWEERLIAAATAGARA